MASTDQPVIIIRKKRRKAAGGDGHGGSAWKVAYADFVTAMMAFFLLLWLLNVTTAEQKQGIADYFDPMAVSQGQSGSGGVLGGLTVSSPGNLSSPSSPFSMHESLPGRPEPADDSNTLDSGATDVVDEDSGDLSFPDLADYEDEVRRLEGRELTEQEVADFLAAREQAQFEQAEQMLRDAIEGVPELAELGENLMIDQTPEGLRIQIVDQDQYSMFPSGSADLLPRSRRLMEMVGQAIRGLPNDVSVRGHTDGTPFADGSQYDNWELSADRANASRRALVDSGMESQRVANVVGKADTDHLFPDEPEGAQNRRISIILLREAPLLQSSVSAEE
ncbi:flagellar motor protein MotB [Fodinicurvata sp. EGI_FJ10296]|uniref:flagellar motor protein MotB n=1 Tax=Fodinicurvata sp. EGI_FJ10296 TaxID=3231908 RepID=UPI0034556399